MHVQTKEKEYVESQKRDHEEQYGKDDEASGRWWVFIWSTPASFFPNATFLAMLVIKKARVLCSNANR
jgi:hypothetical protein